MNKDVLLPKADREYIIQTDSSLRRLKDRDGRVCLSCDTVFLSSGVANRICPECSQKNTPKVSQWD